MIDHVITVSSVIASAQQQYIPPFRRHYFSGFSNLFPTEHAATACDTPIS